MAEDTFDFETYIPDTPIQEIHEEEFFDESPKSARDFIRKKLSKSMKDGSPAWKDGFSAGFMEGFSKGKEEGFKRGWEKAVKDATLPG
jgi:flagellar biosynthesis/type III secretory pathway protein FliH